MAEIGLYESLGRLCDRGVRYSTVIDIGCADGNFVLQMMALNVIPGATVVNIDANALYESSLRAIKQVVGGHYRISAVTDQEGSIEISTGAHPYWASIRPEDDLYWQRVNGLSGGKMTVPATTLDNLATQLELTAPFLLKLDVQGAEEQVLKGGAEFLKNTHVVVCETDVDDFQRINRTLTEKNFILYDITELHRLDDGTLGWFYPIYINKALDHVLPKAFWNEQDNDNCVRAQVERREQILAWNAEFLARFQNAGQSTRQAEQTMQTAAAASGRNQLCTCGSGRKYKHCCGAFR